MNLDTVIFFISAVVAVFGATMMITQRNPIASVLYLVVSLVAQAVCYVQLGALFLGAILVIVYAGAIMVLFLFIVIMLKVETVGERLFPLSQWLPAAVCGVVYLALGMGLVAADPNGHSVLKTARAEPAAFGQYIFQKHWLSIEIVSLLLLVAVIGALLLARRAKKTSAQETIEGEL